MPSFRLVRGRQMDEPERDSNRRQFLSRIGMTVAAAQAGTAAANPQEKPGDTQADLAHIEDLSSSVDFRYAPVRQQTSICFPDDPHKSLVGEIGDLRLGHPGQGAGMNSFATVAEFSLLGMEQSKVGVQRLEAPSIPIVHTRLDRPSAYMEITSFATNAPGEGRVDNVLLEIRPKSATLVAAVPYVLLQTTDKIGLRSLGGGSVVTAKKEPERVVFVSDAPLSPGVEGNVLTLLHGTATEARPLQYFIRFPAEGQAAEVLQAGLRDPQKLIESTRLFWKEWRPYAGSVDWHLASRYNEFLVACTRNILQAREVRNGHLTFQVGPTVYRGLWVVDGNFILEAARYLGYDREAQQGLETTWALQEPDGGIFAGGGREHWKDTGIALFTLVRQAELAQDYTYLKEMQPNALRAIGFLQSRRDRAKQTNSPNGSYGLLPPGMADGGVGGMRSEFTNTLWVLAGLRALLDAASLLKLSGFEDARVFYNELRTAFLAAAKLEMMQHPAGFAYLPMVAKNDNIWKEPDSWQRPHPQSAQWALSHAIYPGLVFEPGDPIVQGHIRLMQQCTEEDIPAETGWLWHGGVWNYNAAFVAEVYLWAGLTGWARSTFHGFLNHATSAYCWREEQPLKESLTATYIGDMPHNWASAECVRYLRHMLALEDGNSLRLLAGIGGPELAGGDSMQIRGSPTRFGRIDITLEPARRNSQWHLKFQRAAGPAPSRVVLPEHLGRKFPFVAAQGASTRTENDQILIDPQAQSWEATWKAAV